MGERATPEGPEYVITIPEITVAIGRPFEFGQANHSESIEGALRGIHAELMDKWVNVIAGLGLAVIVDLRLDSPDYGKPAFFLLGEGLTYGLGKETRGSIFIPGEGIGNSFMALRGNPKREGKPSMSYMYYVSKTYPQLTSAEKVPLYLFDKRVDIPWPTPYTPQELAERGLISNRDFLKSEGGIALSLSEFRAHREQMFRDLAGHK